MSSLYRTRESPVRSACTTARTPGLANSKVAGEIMFATDLAFRDCLWAAMVRSPYPHAVAHSIDVDSVLECAGVHAVYTWADVPNVAFNPALIGQDEIDDATRDKRLLTSRPRHVGDEVAVVVADTARLAYAAARRAAVDWSTRTPALTIDEAIEQGGVVGRATLGKQKARQTIARAGVSVRERFELSRAHHCCMEQPACVAVPYDDSTVEIWTNTQCPAEVRHLVSWILDLDESGVRVRKVDEGGGFGSKQDLRHEALSAWLALRLGRPVGIVVTQHEELMAGRVRSGGRIDLRMGFTDSGVLLASEMSTVLDCGAYVSHTPYVLTCMYGHLATVYPHAEHVFDGVLVRTNTVAAGAYRGYGVAEANFAAEQLMDVAADRLRLTPVEIRERNFVGDRDGRSALTCLRALAQTPTPKASASTDRVRFGSGLAIGAKHSVATADASDVSSAEVTLLPGPRLALTTGTCDSGTGSSRALAALVAAEFGAPRESVVVNEGDTDMLCDIGSTAQRSVFVGGLAARLAAQRARIAVCGAVGHGDDVQLRWPDLVDGAGRRLVNAGVLAADLPPEALRGHATARAQGSGASYCAVRAYVSVDLELGLVQVECVDVAVDCGRVLDDAGARGQVVGGVAQGLGLTLIDEWAPGMDGSGPGSIHDHGVLRSTQAPSISVAFCGDDDDRPFGVGELAIVPTTAAVANAVWNATGVRCTRLPLRSADLWSVFRNGAPQA